MGLYCGIDLHSNNHVLTVIDEADRRVYERRLPNELAITKAALEPYRAELVEPASRSHQGQRHTPQQKSGCTGAIYPCKPSRPESRARLGASMYGHPARPFGFPESGHGRAAQVNRAGYQWPCSSRDKNLPSSTPTSSSIRAFNFSFSPMNNSAFAFPSSAKLRVSCGSSCRS